MSEPARSGKNRLANEKSPYLLQHAENPVEWYPWGEEAFEKARRENKPILLSIGYSTCHWCHVMEHESFENPAIAAVMNEYVVSIKLDREERPDLDKIYMTAVSALTGSGGWPLNVFLTPDRKPFWGGTYFPPEERWGRPGWPQIVERIGRAWRDPEERKKILSSGDGLTRALEEYLSAAKRSDGNLSDAPLRNAFQSFRMSFDGSLGGFSPAPKFPMPVNQHFLFRYYDRAKRIDQNGQEAADCLAMTLDTLRAMARGGLCDQIGGGFHRYSTDERWHVPHFEKMLYDNAQLAVNYLEAYQITRDPELARVARETLDYVRRDMTHPDGGFYSAEDADSLPAADARRKVEGAFYVWSREELIAALGEEDAARFGHRYGVRPEGNAEQDPHGEFTGKNILYQAHTVRETADRFGGSAEELEKKFDAARRALLAIRSRRPRPHLDDKILASWNGLMISAFAKAHQILGEPADLESARAAADFVRERLYDGNTKTLFRRWREGERGIPGMSDDYAFLAQGALDLYEASFDSAWLAWAEELADQLLSRFFEPSSGGFYMTAAGHDKNSLLRVSEDTDNVEPSAASVAALTFLRLAQIMDRPDLREAAEKTLRGRATAMEEQPRAFPYMLTALDQALRPPLQIVLAGDPAAPSMRPFREELRKRFLPHKVLLAAGPEQKILSGKLAFLSSAPRDGAAYVCLDYACKLPATDAKVFAEQLDAL